VKIVILVVVVVVVVVVIVIVVKSTAISKSSKHRQAGTLRCVPRRVFRERTPRIVSSFGPHYYLSDSFVRGGPVQLAKVVVVTASSRSNSRSSSYSSSSNSSNSSSSSITR
jgi:hypothetical protein